MWQRGRDPLPFGKGEGGLRPCDKPPPHPPLRQGGGDSLLGARGGVYSVCARPVSYDYRPSHPHNAGTEHVRVSPTCRHRLHQTRSAVRRSANRMKSELHPKRTARETDFGTLCLLSCLRITAPISYFVFWRGPSRDSNGY